MSAWLIHRYTDRQGVLVRHFFIFGEECLKKTTMGKMMVFEQINIHDYYNKKFT
jgi:hypothetical protein